MAYRDKNGLTDSLDDQAEHFLREHYSGRELRELGILTKRRADMIRKRRETPIDVAKQVRRLRWPSDDQ